MEQRGRLSSRSVGASGHLQSPTALLRPKLLMTCCHHSALCHSPKQDQIAPHRSLRGRKWEERKESYLRAQRGETDILAVRTIRASERRICMGFPQTGNALAVAVIAVQGGPARTAVTAWHLQQCRLLF